MARSVSTFLRYGKYLAAFGAWISGFVMSPAYAEQRVVTLRDAIGLALKQSPRIEIAASRIQEAEAVLKQSRAAFWPKLTMQSSYLWSNSQLYAFGAILNQRSFSPSIDFNDVPATDNLNVQGTIHLPLFAGGANRARYRSVAAAEAAARSQRTVVRQVLAYHVARAYHSITKARAFVEATGASVKAFETNLAVAQRRFDAGSLLKAQLLDLEVQLAEAHEDQLRAQNSADLALYGLKNLLALGASGSDIDIEAGAITDPVPPEAQLQQRAELLALRKAIEAASEQITVAQSGYLPRIDAMGTVLLDYGFRENGHQLAYVAGLMLQWHAWDGLATQGRTEAARARVRRLKSELTQLGLRIDLEVRRARIHLHEATGRLAVLAKAQRSARESVKLARARFEQGLALAMQLIDAEAALTAMRVRHAEAKADEQMARASLRYALGLPQLSLNTEAPTRETSL